MLENNQRSKLLDFLKTRAPFSVVDLGINGATNGQVSECSKVANSVHGVVRDDTDQSFSVSLDFVSGQDTEAKCSCSSNEEMQEQWCKHAVAVLWRACELSFLDMHSGFVAPEAVHRNSSSSPNEIAAVISQISQTSLNTPSHSNYNPKVSIDLDLSSDRLGVQIKFDGEPQAPVLFEGFGKIPNRALDGILLKMLDEEGGWDEQKKLWYVNSSASIEIVLGLIQEYDLVKAIHSKRKVLFSHECLDARLNLVWQASGIELSMEWLLPDGSCAIKQNELIGTGPYWTLVNDTIYRVSANASRIASLFPHSTVLTFSKSKVGPILEELRQGLFDPQFVKIINPELQPESEVKQATPILNISKREPQQDSAFGSSNELELSVVLEFDYPTPPNNSNLVYLPDRQKERECIDLLKSLGLDQKGERLNFSVSADAALDLLHQSHKLIPKDWKIKGLDTVRKSLKFAELSIKVAINSPAAEFEGSKTKGHGIDWFDCQVTLSQNNAHVPLSTLFKNTKVGSDRWVRLDSGAYAQVPGGGLNQLRTTLGLLDPNFRLTNTIKTKLSTAQAVSFSNLKDDQFVLALDSKLKALSNKLKEFQSIDKAKISKNFHGKLRSYQHEGLSWLNFLQEFSLGGILADEMGLGKTVQTLAFIQAYKDSRAKDKSARKPALVIAPTSVITNWSYEAQRFTPELSVLLLHGPGRKAHFPEIAKHDIVITSYALLRLDRLELERFEFSYLILDEAQNIKNPDTATTRAAKALKSRGRLALSGTPTENRPLELWSIMDFLMPGYLGSIDFFKNSIEKPILEGGPGVNVAKFLNSKTKPFILRRTKAEVEKDLPPKIESSQYVSMTPSQAQVYAQILEEVRPRVFDAIEKSGIRGASVSILAALLRLRQVCNHPNSIEALKELPGYDSGKFNLLKDLVEESLAAGHKVLLFSQFREMLSIIRRHLDQTGVNHLYLDGATRNRQELIDQFNSDSNIRLFLVSLKAGGTGLNLTAADTVIIYDPWWNPAVESQAVDRAHRIGQTKPVTVYRLITENSIEQKIMQLKAKKAKLVDALINDNGLSTLSLTKTDLESLFSPLPTESIGDSEI